MNFFFFRTFNAETKGGKQNSYISVINTLKNVLRSKNASMSYKFSCPNVLFMIYLIICIEYRCQHWS